MCALYSHILGRMDVRADHDFFADLNGDSLAAAQVIAVLEDLFEINVVDEFFDNSSPAGITPILERHLHGRAAGGCPWPGGSPLLGDALASEVARLREHLPPPSLPAPA
jgi:hypothetical protein